MDIISTMFANISDHNNIWILQIFAVIFLTAFADWLQRLLIIRLTPRIKRSKNYWDDVLLEAAKKPLTMLIWIAGLRFAISMVQEEKQALIFEAVGPLVQASTIIALTWFIIRFTKLIEHEMVQKKLREEKQFDRSTIDAVGKLLRISTYITSFLVILQTWGYSISGVLAFGGVGGIAIGFAARDLLANFFGGLMIYLDRPFAVGDWIRSPDKEIEGTVEYIGWRLTRICTFDKRPLYVPNSIFTTIAVENPSRMSNRRIKETIGIRYEDAAKMGSIITAVKQMLETHPEIDTNQTLIVNFNSYAPSSLDFFIYTFTKTTNWVLFHEIKQDILLRIMEIIQSKNAECAFPTSTIHVPESITIKQDK